jgi:hypothetical protein
MSVRGSMLAVVLLAAPLISWAPDWAREDWPRQLVARCRDVALPANSGLRIECSPSGAFAAFFGEVDMAIAHRMGATALWSRWHDQVIRRGGVRVFSSGSLVIVEHTTCGACRRVMGTTWMIDPALASAATLAAAQREAGLRAAPLLRTVAAWRTARP